VIAEDAGKQIDVGEARNIVQRQRLAGEKAGNHQWQRSVLGPTDRYGAGQALAADNAHAVHGVLLPQAESTPLGARPVLSFRAPPHLWTKAWYGAAAQRLIFAGSADLSLTPEAMEKVPPRQSGDQAGSVLEPLILRLKRPERSMPVI
jgi:hypothetical protein